MEETPQGSVSPVTDEQARASASDAAVSKAARDLAATLVQNNANPDSVQILKATVAAVDAGTTTVAPTVSIYLQGDTTASIPGVAYYDSYSPVVGDTVQVLKVGNQIAILGQLNDVSTGSANGWITPTLASGVTSVASDPIRYRVVYDNGDRKVQLRGAVALNASQTTLWTMPVGVRPAANLAPFLVAQNAGGDASNIALSVQPESGGAMRLYHGGRGIDLAQTNPGGGGTTSTSGVQYDHEHKFLNLEFGQVDAYRNADCRVHFGVNSTHNHTIGTHVHNYVLQDYPDEIYFTGVEYYLS